MSDAFRSDSVAATNEVDPSTLSWSAIIGGGLAALALTLILISFGAAVGFSSVSPWSGSGVSATTFKVATGLYLVFTAMVASTIGGYMAGRLRRKWVRLYAYEVQFRDTAHGLLAWALATVVGAAMLGSAATFLAGGVAAGASAGASSAATQQAAGPNDYFVSLLFRPAANRPPADVDPAYADRAAGMIFARSLVPGSEFAAADRTYLAQLVSARTGLNQADAEKRVTDVTAQAKTAADEARKAAASLSIWLTIAMVVGAFCASFAALEGGQLRDRRWKGVIGGRAYNEARIEG
jgi:hypothetical protein